MPSSSNPCHRLATPMRSTTSRRRRKRPSSISTSFRISRAITCRRTTRSRPQTMSKSCSRFWHAITPRSHSSPARLEIGCGPTVHHVLPLAPFVSEIHMADYLPDNLEQVRRWRDGVPDAHRWNHYTALTLSLEGRETTNAEIERRETDTRRKITSLLHCDLKRDQPLHTAQTVFRCHELLLRREHRHYPRRMVQSAAASRQSHGVWRVPVSFRTARNPLLRS